LAQRKIPKIPTKKLNKNSTRNAIHFKKTKNFPVINIIVCYKIAEKSFHNK
jgi:hypothetical protein